MKKIPTIFQRNPGNRSLVLNEPTPGCEWVFSGEGVARRKFDGTCCLVESNELWKRREVRRGKTIPAEFRPVDDDPITGKTVGWMPVTEDKEDRWHREAFGNGGYPDGTYELCGPKVQGNPERYNTHVLVPHAGADQYSDVDRTYEGIRAFLEGRDIEGLVFAHPDGRMAKIKKRDLGLSRTPS